MEFARPWVIDLVFFCYLGVFMFFERGDDEVIRV